MKSRQRVILLALVLTSFLYHGLRWKQGVTEMEVALKAVSPGATVLAASEPEKRHCPLVHVNTAGMAELQTLPGIGPIYAERIIIARREEPFRKKEDLLRIAGIGEKRLAQLRDLICLYPEGDDRDE